MSDPNTPENSTTPESSTTPAVEPDADTTPTAAMAPVAAAAPTAAASDQSSGRNTRTILEIVGGVAAAVLIVVAAGVGFVAGIAVGDSHDRDGRGYEQAGEMWGGHGDRGRGHDGHGDRGGFGDGPMEGFGDGQMGGPMNQGIVPQG